MGRLALSDTDKEVRHWFTKQAESLGCKVTVDQIGTQMAIKPGKNKNKKAAPIMIGSHLDTQPTGGRYDGILGITAGLEVLKTLQENNYETEGPIGIVNWTRYVTSPCSFASSLFPTYHYKYSLTNRFKAKKGLDSR
jgi:Zn-dependent M28 family amino/carboxypeptidase